MGSSPWIALAVGCLGLAAGCATAPATPERAARTGAPVAFALMQPIAPAAAHGQVTFLAEPNGVRVRAHLERLAPGEYSLWVGSAAGDGAVWMPLLANNDGLCRTDAVLAGRPAPVVGAQVSVRRGAGGEVVARGRIQAARRP